MHSSQLFPSAAIVKRIVHFRRINTSILRRSHVAKFRVEPTAQQVTTIASRALAALSQAISVPMLSLKIRVSDEKINRLVKRGYLGPNEVDDAQAIRQALSLFVWDALLGAPRQTASKAAKRLGGGKSLDQESP
jgi:hypothetical protein